MGEDSGVIHGEFAGVLKQLESVQVLSKNALANLQRQLLAENSDTADSNAAKK